MYNRILFSTCLFFVLLIIFSLRIPFFWDGTFFSGLSVFFYDNGFNGLIGPQQFDSGGFPLFSIYLTIAWKIFDKTLVISHLAILPFIIGIVYEYFKLSKKFLHESLIFIAILLLIAEPTFITQCMLMGYDILMLYFFMLVINTLLSNRPILFSLAFTFLCISNIRGIFLAGSIFLIELFINKKLNWHIVKKYLPGFTFLIIWMIYHKLNTGWLLFSPERERTHESILHGFMMIRQLFYITWKIADFGRFVLWLFIPIGLFMLYRNKQITTELKKLLLIIFIPLIVTVCFMIFLANPIGHRYFMFAYLPLIIGSCYILQQLSNKKIRFGIAGLFLVALITGNFWLYPERFGNGWDSSLKVLPYFELKEQMDHYILKHNIQPEEVGTQFPLIADKRYSHLTDTPFHYSNVWSGPINHFNYFLHSNVINTDIPEQIQQVKGSWQLLKQFRKGQVYIQLYKNTDSTTTTFQ